MARPPQANVRNRLLAALAPDDFARLAPALEPFRAPVRQTLIAPRQGIAYVYFVEDGIVSLVADAAEGRIEIGLVGREGLVGVPMVLGADRTPHTAIVQADLVAVRVAAPALGAALDASPTLRGLLGRYVQSLLVQVGQTVQAHADLTVDGRLSRWILMTHDRLGRDELPMTHEFLAVMLGVRRPSVTTAVHILEGAGLIRARRGRIVVLDRERLLEMAGESYGLAEAEYERLLAGA